MRTFVISIHDFFFNTFLSRLVSLGKFLHSGAGAGTKQSAGLLPRSAIEEERRSETGLACDRAVQDKASMERQRERKKRKRNKKGKRKVCTAEWKQARLDDEMERRRSFEKEKKKRNYVPGEERGRGRKTKTRNLRSIVKV